MISVIKIGDSEYRISGTHILGCTTVKTVVFDGETYYKTVTTDKVFDFDADFLSETKCRNWEIITLSELSFLGGHPVVFHDYNFDYGSAQCRAFGQYSENRAVNLYNGLKNDFNEFANVKNIYSGKLGYSAVYAEKYFYETGSILVAVFQYGFGNCLYAEVSLEAFLCSNIPNISTHTKWAYSRMIPEIKTAKRSFSDDQKFEIATRLLNNSIEHNGNNKQRPFSAHL